MVEFIEIHISSYHNNLLSGDIEKVARFGFEILVTYYGVKEEGAGDRWSKDERQRCLN